MEQNNIVLNLPTSSVTTETLENLMDDMEMSVCEIVDVFNKHLNNNIAKLTALDSLELIAHMVKPSGDDVIEENTAKYYAYQAFNLAEKDNFPEAVFLALIALCLENYPNNHDVFMNALGNDTEEDKIFFKHEHRILSILTSITNKSFDDGEVIPPPNMLH